jgi:hypothetical protein
MGLLYRSKPSFEATNVFAGTPECKGRHPGLPRRITSDQTRFR